MKNYLLFVLILILFGACTDDPPKLFNSPAIDLEPISSGLIAHYYFNTNANDQTSGKRNGKLNGPITFVTSRDNKQVNAAAFNGKNTFINMSGANLINDSSTVSIWFQVSRFPNAGDTAVFLSVFNSQNSFKLGFYNKNYDSGKLLVEQKVGTKYFTTASDSLPIVDRWYHIAVTSTPKESILYLNGKIYARVNTQQGDWVFPSSTTAYIGSTNIKSGFLEGYLDDLRIYKKVLNPQQIIDLYTE